MSIPYYQIVNSAFRLILKNKQLSADGIYNQHHIVKAINNYLNHNNTHFNIRMKKKLLEYEENKISDFIIVKVANIEDTVNSIEYTCYFSVTLCSGGGITIVLPSKDCDHKTCIQEYIKNNEAFSKYKLFSENIDKIFELSEMFQQYADVSKNNDIHQFKVKRYCISESKAYKEYIVKQEFKRAKKEIRAKYLGGIEKSDQVIVNTSAEINEPIQIVHHNHSIDVYTPLSKLLSIDEKTMLFLLGYFISCCFNSDVPPEYLFAVNLQKKNIKDIKRIYDLLYILIYNKYNNKHTYYKKSDKFLKNLRKSDYMILVITLPEFNKSDTAYMVETIEKYYEGKPNKLKSSIVIASKKDISSDYIKNIPLSFVDSQPIVELKDNDTIYESKHEFFDYMQARIKYNKDLIEDSLEKRYKALRKKSILSKDETDKYTPVIYFLEEYFEYLLKSESITDKEYNILSKKCKALYLPETDAMEEIKKEDKASIEDMSLIILKLLSKAYKDGNIDTAEKLSRKPCLYKQNQKYKELICFPHVENSPLQEIVKFLETFDSEHEMELIRDKFLNKKIAADIKKHWKKEHIIHVSSGSVYKSRGSTYLAFIPEKLNEFSN